MSSRSSIVKDAAAHVSFMIIPARAVVDSGVIEKGAMVNGVETRPIGAEISNGIRGSRVVNEQAILSSFAMIQPEDIAGSYIPEPAAIPVLLGGICDMAIAVMNAGVVHEKAIVAVKRLFARRNASTEVILEDAGLYATLWSTRFRIPELNGSSRDISSSFAFRNDTVLDEQSRIILYEECGSVIRWG